MVGQDVSQWPIASGGCASLKVEDMTAQAFAVLKRRATRNPDGVEALRLRWLEARVLTAPLTRLLDLVRDCRSRGFSIAEIDQFVEEQLALARGRLTQAQRLGAAPERRLRALERAIDAAEAGERARPQRAFTPHLLQALEMADELAARASRSSTVKPRRAAGSRLRD